MSQRGLAERYQENEAGSATRDRPNILTGGTRILGSLVPLERWRLLDFRAAVPRLSLELRRARDHGVTRAFIQRVKQRGYGNPSLDEVIRLRDRGLE